MDIGEVDKICKYKKALDLGKKCFEFAVLDPSYIPIILKNLIEHRTPGSPKNIPSTSCKIPGRRK